MLGVAHLWVSAYGHAALILVLALLVGYPAVRRVLHGPAAPIVMVLVGLAALSLLVCALAWLRIFGGAALAVIAIIGAAASTACAFADAPRWRERLRSAGAPSVPTAASFALLLAVLLAFSLLAIYPSTAFDATSYHLPLAGNLVDRHGLVYDPFVRYSFFPQANEALFAVMLLLTRNPEASAALEFSVLALAVIALPLWFISSGRRVGGGLIGGLVVLASPVVIFAGTAAFVDTWTLVFVLASLLVGLDAVEGRTLPLPTLVIAGMLWGEAAATKYTGAAFGAAAFVGVLVAAGRGSAVWRAIPGVLGGLVVIAVPWYAWTIHTTGDPLYPFATGLFGNRHGLWTAGEIRFQRLVARGFAGPGIGGVLRRDWSYLRGSIQYDTGLHRSPLSWWLGSGFVGLLVRSVRRDRAFRGAAVAGALCIVMSLLISADPRYLVPAIGPLALCAGLAAVPALRAAGQLVGSWRYPQGLAPLWGGAAVVVLLWSAAGYALDFRSSNGNPPTGSRETAAYLSARIPCYAAVGYLNGRAGSHYRAWGYECEQARYYARGRVISDAFSLGSRSRVFDAGGAALPGDMTLWRRLEPLSVQWLIVPRAFVPVPSALETHRLFRFSASVGPEDIFQVLTRGRRS